MRELIKKIIGSLKKKPVISKKENTLIQESGYDTYTCLIRSDDIGDIPLFSFKALPYAYGYIHKAEEIFNRRDLISQCWREEDNILYIDSTDVMNIYLEMYAYLSSYIHHVQFNPSAEGYLEVKFLNRLPLANKELLARVVFKKIIIKKTI